MNRNIPEKVRDLFDQLLLTMDEIHRETVKGMEECVESLKINDPQHHEQMLQDEIVRVARMLQMVTELAEAYRNSIVCQVDQM